MPKRPCAKKHAPRPRNQAEAQQHQRRPLGREEVQVFQVGDAGWGEGVGDAGQDAGQPVAGQVVDEQVHGESREDEGQQGRDVVGQDAVLGDSDDGQDGQRLADEVVGVGERVAPRVEDVGVEDAERVGAERVPVPGDRPCLEDRIAPGDEGVVHPRGERPRQQQRHDDEDRQRREMPSDAARLGGSILLVHGWEVYRVLSDECRVPRKTVYECSRQNTL